MNISNQISDLRKLETGWYEGYGVKPKLNGLNWLEKVMVQWFPGDIPQPHLYPTVLGDISAEWSIGNKEVSLAVNLETHEGIWHVIFIGGGESELQTFNCNQKDNWDWMAGRIKEMMQETQDEARENHDLS